MSDQPTPDRPGFRRYLDPAAVPLVIGGAVLVLAVIWLLATPRPDVPPPPDPELIARVERRIGELEQRRPPNIGPLERRVATLEGRPAVDTAPLAERLAALEARAVELAARPTVDRAALEQLGTRLERLAERMDALATRLQATDAEAARRTEDLARSLNERVAALGRNEAERAQQAAAQAEQRVAAGQAGLEQRIAAVQSGLEQRLAAAQGGIEGRLATLEQAQQRLTALEGRAARLAALDALRERLDAGQPLGPALRTLPEPPAALARFAEAPPPTEAALRLSFEDAARAARAASEPAREGQGVLDAAVTRLSGLVTIRRGEEVVWGDAAAAELERARRALEAGDLDAALARLTRLPPPAQEAMRGWTEQARALAAARAALRSLAG